MAKKYNPFDYYKYFDLNRGEKSKVILKALKQEQRKWINRQNSANPSDKWIFDQINENLTRLDEAIEIFSDSFNRKDYDEQLDQWYKNGTLTSKEVAAARDALERAREFYRKREYKLAVQNATEALNNGIETTEVFELIYLSYIELGDTNQALGAVSRGLQVHPDDTGLLWMSARVNSISHSFDTAQANINHMLELDPESTLAKTEQVFLYMSADKEDIALQQIDMFVSQHPDNTRYKKEVARTLISFSAGYYTSYRDSLVIISKEAYEGCKRLCEKAYQLDSSDENKQQLERARYFGKTQFNKGNIGGIFLFGFPAVMIIVVGIIAIASGHISEFITFEEIKSNIAAFLYGAGWYLICIIMGPLMTVKSFQPYWELYRYKLTGSCGKLTDIINKIGSVCTWALKTVLRLMPTIFKMIFSLIGW